MTKWAWIMLCVVMAGFLSFVRLGIQETVIYEFRNVSVSKTAPFEYWLMDEKGKRFHATVCRDYYEPGFDTGMVLVKVIFVDQGNCWSLDPNKHAGYFIARREDGRPIIETSN